MGGVFCDRAEHAADRSIGWWARDLRAEPAPCGACCEGRFLRADYRRIFLYGLVGVRVACALRPRCRASPDDDGWWSARADARAGLCGDRALSSDLSSHTDQP